MPHTSFLPNYDALAAAPSTGTASPLSGFNSEETPTARVPVRAAASIVAVAHPVPQAPPVTPAPVSQLRFHCSDWSNDGDYDAPIGRRAPRVGDTLIGFKLVGELGRGAFARVFLAHQEALANRPVALKVTLRPTREAERLARLQHTNVVPVYSVHTEGSAQLICMPFLGRSTLADLVRAYRTDHPSRHSGRKSTSARAARSTAFDNRSKSSARSDGKSGSSRVPTWTWTSEEPPPIVGDPVAVLQVLAQLADGLTHAHERGILHLDLKPANVLLADTGEPMLLDFNLSFDSSNPEREHVGGTMPYMAIEQLLDMRDRGKGTIDERTDLYALGVMAFELLTGTVPFPVLPGGLRDIKELIAAREQGPPSLRERNPEVTPAVEVIVRKLLAPAPADRYQTAQQLREDIERHLSDQPLKYARETSLRERFGKWRRRNPRLPLRILVAGLIGLTIMLGGLAHRRAEANARAEAVELARETRESLDTVRLDLILPDDAKARARGIKRASELLAAYGLPEDADWRNRPEVRRLPEANRAELAGDLGELMILLAYAKWREAGTRPESERRQLVAEAWMLNTAARSCFAEGEAPPLLNRQAATLAPAAGEEFDVFANTPAEPANARDQFLDAVYALMYGRYSGATELLDRVIAARPNHAAAQFCLAYCRQKMGQYERALERYDAAQVLLPSDARPAYQRGLIHGVCKRLTKAEDEFSKVLTLNPDHYDAYRHRALARYRFAMLNLTKKGEEKAFAKKMLEAEADLTAAFERGAPAPFIHFIRAQIRDKRGDAAGAKADRDATNNLVLKTEEDYVASGWSRMERDPKGALADFQKAEELNPHSLIALQNKAYVLAEKLKDNDAALEVATKVAELYPEFAPAVAGRAVLLARVGRRAESHKEIERARLLSDDPEVLYQAASVYSVTSVDNPEDRPKAIALLRESLQRGHVNLHSMASDPDLTPLRGVPEFQHIWRAASTIYR